MMKDGWYCCPVCGQRLCRVGEHPLARNLYLWCKHCKAERKVEI